MKTLKHISKLIPYINDAFTEFYDAMLSDPKLSIFFENDEQIQHLIKMQKARFLKTLSMEDEEIQNLYIRLGEYHYDIKIPYVDFIKGAQILEEYFLMHAGNIDNCKEIIKEIFIYFKYMKSFTAKGYLNRMIEEDQKDIDNFFSHSNDECFQSPYITAKIKWLRKLLDRIMDDVDIDNIDLTLECWSEEITKFSKDKKEFICSIEKRIMLNTQNLFYFLKRQDYLEILPLYSSLLEIYKLTLLLNNLVTVEIADETICCLKIDGLSKFLRKESFEEILKKEINYAKRYKEYTFSVAYIDFDNFKYINDNFDHYSGDKVIEKFGETVRNNIRGSDIAFRIGGNEFAIIFKNATKEAAKKVCQKIETEFSSYEFVFNDETVFKVTLSIGVVEYNRNIDIDFNSMIERVDAKLYEAKKNGKNQIVY